MKLRGVWLIACLGLVVGVSPALAASTTNYSDEWLSPGEPGWGVTIQQQRNVVFVELSVYGTDHQATWLTATAIQQALAPSGHTVFAGDLYRSHGPYFGASWDPAAMGYRKVGTLTFDATDANAARLTYTIDGVTVVKELARLTLTYENLSGTYYGGWTATCGNVWWPWVDSPIRIDVDHRADNSVSVVLRHVEPDMQYHDPLVMTGTYAQSGRLGQIDAAVVGGGSGAITFFELEKTVAGFTGRMKGTITLGMACPLVDGRIGVVRR